MYERQIDALRETERVLKKKYKRGAVSHFWIYGCLLCKDALTRGGCCACVLSILGMKDGGVMGCVETERYYLEALGDEQTSLIDETLSFIISLRIAYEQMEEEQ